MQKGIFVRAIIIAPSRRSLISISDGKPESIFPENALEAQFVCISIIAPWKKQEVIPR